MKKPPLTRCICGCLHYAVLCRLCGRETKAYSELKKLTDATRAYRGLKETA